MLSIIATSLLDESESSQVIETHFAQNVCTRWAAAILVRGSSVIVELHRNKSHVYCDKTTIFVLPPFLSLVLSLSLPFDSTIKANHVA